MPVAGESKADFENRELYNRNNAFWSSSSVHGLLDEVADQEEKDALVKRIDSIKEKYDKLSETYQATKGNAGIPLA